MDADLFTRDIYWGKVPSIAEFHKKKFLQFCEQGDQTLKQACLDEDGRLKHIIRAEHFDLDFLKTIRDTANAARRISKVDPNFLKALLRHVSILNFFAQPSSRTFLSFSRAESKIGIQREEVRDLKTSSHVKGESDLDSLRTLSSFFEGIITRHPSDYFDQFAVWSMKQSARPLHIINAGSGKKEHPTQAILDHYTMVESLGNLDGKTIAFVGDCLRGRTVHSATKLLALHKNVTIYYIAPPEFQVDEETQKYAENKGVFVHKVTTGLGNIPERSDVIYMTRIQNEHGGADAYPKEFVFSKEMFYSMRTDAILMHPMPKREEIDPELDYMKADPRILFWRQQRNGMWTRLATLAYVYKVDEKIREKYQSLKIKMKKIVEHEQRSKI